MSLGQFIVKRRKNMRLTQEQLAERIHVSKSAVAKWETDGGIPDRDNMYRLADVLHINVNELYHIIDEKDLSEFWVEPNITKDVIATLESYGYTVIGPNENNPRIGGTEIEEK